MAKTPLAAASRGSSVIIAANELKTDASSFEKLRQRITDGVNGSGAKLVISGPGSSLDQTKIAVLAELCAEARIDGITLTIDGIGQDLSKAILRAAEEIATTEPAPPLPENILERIGEEAIEVAQEVVGWRRFVADVLEAIFVDPLIGQRWRWPAVAEQLEKTGIGGVPIVVFISVMIGTVLALNGAHQLRNFGASIFIADLVGVAMTREMGPLITAIIVAGRSGSAIAAELGTMVVSEEIDALKTMALPPSSFLLAPRVIALLISVPCLTVLSDVAGVLGGFMVGTLGMGLGSGNYMRRTAQSLLISDIVAGLVKSGVYALLIGLISCYEGLHVHGGAEGVGTATTRAVVSSIIACIAADAVFTFIFYVFG